MGTNQNQSVSISNNQDQSPSISTNQHQSTSISVIQHQSESISINILCPLWHQLHWSCFSNSCSLHQVVEWRSENVREKMDSAQCAKENVMHCVLSWLRILLTVNMILTNTIRSQINPLLCVWLQSPVSCIGNFSSSELWRLRKGQKSSSFSCSGTF